jgi:hypothetical protein
MRDAFAMASIESMASWATRRRPWARAALGLALVAASAEGYAQVDLPTIRGVITVDPSLVDHIAPDDRLIIKLYHLEGGVELDAKSQIVPRFKLPFPFMAAPPMDLNARTRYDAYVVEVLTDKDGDVSRIAPGELIARTPEPVPLGTTGLRLELDALHE